MLWIIKKKISTKGDHNLKQFYIRWLLMLVVENKEALEHNNKDKTGEGMYSMSMGR